MDKIASIGGLLKKNYRVYASILLEKLMLKGHVDLRPSFLEILMFLTEQEASSIKEIGRSIDLKKQTMTSHLNELEKRGYIERHQANDKREQRITLSSYGEKFRIHLNQAVEELNLELEKEIGATQLEKLDFLLGSLFTKIKQLP